MLYITYIYIYTYTYMYIYIYVHTMLCRYTFMPFFRFLPGVFAGGGWAVVPLRF